MFNSYLIQNILKNNIYIGSLSINKDMKKFIYTINNKDGRSIFDVSKQARQIYKVCLLLKGLKRRKKPILFFGLNPLKINFQDKIVASSLNKQIFKLGFSIIDPEKKEFIDSRIDDFYDSVYVKKIYKNSEIESVFMDFYNFIELAIKNEEVSVNGHFFGNWGEGSISNYHCLMALLRNSLKDDGDAKILEESILTERFQNLMVLSYVLGKSKKLPGAVVFFSREGYDYFFSELKKLGVPVVCIVNSNESLKNIDFPLLGDNSLLNVIYFYQKIIKFILR